ncbi:hypothetical protein MMPV_000331 [Pyropia vietnamensis]
MAGTRVMMAIAVAVLVVASATASSAVVLSAVKQAAVPSTAGKHNIATSLGHVGTITELTVEGVTRHFVLMPSYCDRRKMAQGRDDTSVLVGPLDPKWQLLSNGGNPRTGSEAMKKRTKNFLRPRPWHVAGLVTNQPPPAPRVG